MTVRPYPGNLIDPPAPQNAYRPCGVYRTPDLRYPPGQRVLIEVWNAHGECLIASSVLAREADADYEWRIWNFLDERTDMRQQANGPSSRLGAPVTLRLV